MNLGWHWYPFPWGSGDGLSGLARGYVASAFFLHRALEAQLGARLVGCDQRNPGHAKMRLHYCPPHYFRPQAGKLDVLFTMWEGNNLPEQVVRQLRAADILLVPSEHNRHVFRQHDLDAHVVPLGVPDEYLQADPSRPMLLTAERQVRVLWVGSTSSRKGMELLQPAWTEALRRLGPGAAWLYVKTIAPKAQGRRRFDRQACVVDTRDLDATSMAKLYLQADVILSTSYGEGFGLPALEGMALGALAVVPFVGGMRDFCSEATAWEVATPRVARLRYGSDWYTQATVTPESVADALEAVVRGFGTPAVENKRRLGTMLARSMTWAASADRLLDAICEAGGESRARVWPRASNDQGQNGHGHLVVPA